MSAGHWDDEDSAPWHMQAEAEDEGRVYQAGRDQHITEYHFHGTAPDAGDYDDDGNDGWEYADQGGSPWGGTWETLLSVLLALVPLLPLAIAGAGTRAVWTDRSDPSNLWSVLFSLGAVIVGATVFSILRERLSYRTHLIDAVPWLYVPVSIGIFFYYAIRDPADAPFKFIGDLGLELARWLGPL
ncbi:hypothetical protein [Streptomyces sp. NPDC051162]|uniref:hypothetical protein n=1 Tax=Streptomyces sp. NPDC051162 TaxID=3154747 RepID=UPI003415BC29